jgi:hypothetical protein
LTGAAHVLTNKASPDPDGRHTSALSELAQRLRDSGSDADPALVAAAILGIAHTGHWIRNPQAMVEWIGQLALDMVQVGK